MPEHELQRHVGLVNADPEMQVGSAGKVEALYDIGRESDSPFRPFPTDSVPVRAVPCDLNASRPGVRRLRASVIHPHV